MKENLLHKCLFPRVITNKYTGDRVFVNCGQCVTCKQSKDSMNTLKCQLESQCHRFTLFVTLTFNNVNLPLMTCIPVDDCEPLTRDSPVNFHWCRCDSYGNLLSDEVMFTHPYSYNDLEILIKKFNLSHTRGEAIFPVLEKRAVQLFLKRLRKLVTNEKIRYYVTGEYGPVSFRPHYHFLLWFEEEETLQTIRENLSSLWPYGRFDSQISRGRSASYVASYLHSSSNLPSIYSLYESKPFSLHSHFLGEKFFEISKKEIYEDVNRSVTERSILVDGINREISLWRSLKTTYFPRCQGYNSLSPCQRLLSYRSYGIIAKITGETSLEEQVRIVINSFYKKREFLPFDPSGTIKSYEYQSLLSLFSKVLESPDYLLNLTDFESPRRLDLFEEQKTLFRRIYMILRTSKHFIEFVCDGITDFSYQSKMYRKIEEFWKLHEYHVLSNSLKDMEEVSLLDSNFIGELDTYYYVNGFDFDKYKELDIYTNYKKQRIQISHDRCKHKTLNDKNKIFSFI